MKGLDFTKQLKFYIINPKLRRKLTLLSFYLQNNNILTSIII